MTSTLLSTGEPPHLRRLLERVRRSPATAIALWAWPGSGAGAVVDALAETAGKRAALLTRAGDPVPRDAEWVIWRGDDPPEAEVFQRELPPGCRLLVVTRAQPAPRQPPIDTVAPREFLLTEAEMHQLFRQHARPTTAGDLERRLWAATDGWWAPAELALASTAGRRFEASPAGLVALPAIVQFLRQDLLSTCSRTLLDALYELAILGGVEESFWHALWRGDDPRREARREIVVERGWVVEPPTGNPRLPRLLAAFLRADRSRHWTPRQSTQTCLRLAAASYSAGLPARALRALVEANDPRRAVDLIQLEWPQLLATAPVELLRDALRIAPPVPGGGVELLYLALETVLGDRRRAAAGLAELASRSGRGSGAQEAGIEAISRLLLSQLRGGGPAPEVAAAARQTLAAIGPVPAPLEDLIGVTAGHPVAARQVDLPGLASVVEHLLVVASQEVAHPKLPGRALGREVALPGEKPRVRLELFGLPRVEVETTAGFTEVQFKLRKSFLVLAFLASSAGLRASRDEIMEAVWEELGEKTERNFHPTLSYLRRALTGGLATRTPPLELVAGVYRLSPAIDWQIDTLEFEALLQRGRQRAEAGDLGAAIEIWQNAWHLHGGAFLEGHYASWVEVRREALRAKHLELLHLLGASSLEHGEMQRAIDAYRSLVMVDPLQEHAHLALMRIYSRQSRRDLVRVQYARLAEVLRAELALEPTPETTLEYHRLMG